MLIQRLLKSDRVKKGDFLVACELPSQDPSTSLEEAERRRHRQIDFLHKVSDDIILFMVRLTDNFPHRTTSDA